MNHIIKYEKYYGGVILRYIGPFLKVNTLNSDNIKSQLFYFSRESLRQIVLHSGCGIVSKDTNFRNKPLPTDDNITNSDFSPLLCVYRKADGKMVRDKDKLYWNRKKFKKEINICANGYMTLSLLYLSDYYRQFEVVDKSKFNLSQLYRDISAQQLEFYALNMRNTEGLFVDKYDSTDPLQKEYTLTIKDIKFKFSTQAILMAAYYKCSLYSNEYKDVFKDFSLDILKLFKTYKNGIYNTSHDELIKICIALNIMYKDSKLDDVKDLLLDFSKLAVDNIKHMPPDAIRDNIDVSCMSYINDILTYANTGLKEFKDAADNLFEILDKMYDNANGIFVKDICENENKYSSDEIVLYLYTFMLQSTDADEDKKNELTEKIHSIFKKLVVNSGIVLRWIDPPPLDDVERYRSFNSKPENLLTEDYFRSVDVHSPSENDLAPIFIKNISLNRKKESYKQYKHHFDSCKNMFNCLIIIMLQDYI